MNPESNIKKAMLTAHRNDSDKWGKSLKDTKFRRQNNKQPLSQFLSNLLS